ncbi:hypothetical protein [Archangium lipolyticum]|uniref:hypothetical protein n=1 Tax=Archangium lipolyticum TaxID=2970465 RepID=UPI00214A24D9|nr:hypothetical protein [Archangium lipolyticum]
MEALLSFGGMGLIVALLVLPWLPKGFKWVGWVLLLGGLELLVSRATRLPAYRRMVQKRKQLEREQPDYALVLHRWR